MSISMSSASLPILQAMLSNLSHFLDKAQADAEARKYDPAVLMQARLAPDMLPFTRQVLIACDAAKNGIARLAGVDAPKFDDLETTIPELKARIQKTLDFLATIPVDKIDGSQARDITFPTGRETTRTLKGDQYLQRNLLPNFFFHVTTAYAVLRHNGVRLGKSDYLVGANVI